jgi:2-polyprenyl-6-methoxyphenol hydroxylase-like FAD-dependent oxidoreductase
LLAQHGMSVIVLDSAKELDNRPQATHSGPPAVYELHRAGDMDDILAEGFLPGKICWRKLDGTYIGGINNGVLGDHPDRVACLPLDGLGKILLRHLQQNTSAEIKWNHRVTDIEQEDDKAWVKVATDSGEVTMEADYIVGRDGVSSQIRRSLHGDWTFHGTTSDEQIVATNVYYDFDQYGHEDANSIIHLMGPISNTSQPEDSPWGGVWDSSLEADDPLLNYYNQFEPRQSESQKSSAAGGLNLPIGIMFDPLWDPLNMRRVALQTHIFEARQEVTADILGYL